MASKYRVIACKTLWPQWSTERDTQLSFWHNLCRSSHFFLPVIPVAYLWSSCWGHRWNQSILAYLSTTCSGTYGATSSPFLLATEQDQKYWHEDGARNATAEPGFRRKLWLCSEPASHSFAVHVSASLDLDFTELSKSSIHRFQGKPSFQVKSSGRLMPWTTLLSWSWTRDMSPPCVGRTQVRILSPWLHKEEAPSNFQSCCDAVARTNSVSPQAPGLSICYWARQPVLEASMKSINSKAIRSGLQLLWAKMPKCWTNGGLPVLPVWVVHGFHSISATSRYHGLRPERPDWPRANPAASECSKSSNSSFESSSPWTWQGTGFISWVERSPRT